MNRRIVLVGIFIGLVADSYYLGTIATIDASDIKELKVLHVDVTYVCVKIAIVMNAVAPTYLPSAKYRRYLIECYVGLGEISGTFLSAGENIVYPVQDIKYQSLPSVIANALLGNGYLEVGSSIW